MTKVFRERCYQPMKDRYPDAILLVRFRDEYHAFDDDAKKVSDVINKPMCIDAQGEKYVTFEYRALDRFLPKIIRAGYRVAITDNITSTL